MGFVPGWGGAASQPSAASALVLGDLPQDPDRGDTLRALASVLVPVSKPVLPTYCNGSVALSVLPAFSVPYWQDGGNDSVWHTVGVAMVGSYYVTFVDYFHHYYVTHIPPYSFEHIFVNISVSPLDHWSPK